MVTADKITRSKPDPECYLLAARELQINRMTVVSSRILFRIEAGRVQE
ncbi:MAG: hypothetical protein ACLTZT_11430 [Butyricimonas faecalis]